MFIWVSDEPVELDDGTYAMGGGSALPSERTSAFTTTGETREGEDDDHNAGILIPFNFAKFW